MRLISPIPGAPGFSLISNPPKVSAITVPSPVLHFTSAMWASWAALTQDKPSPKASFKARARLNAPAPLEPKPYPMGT